VYSGRATEDTDVGGERRLQPGLTGLALNTLNERRLLTADIGTSASVNVDIKIESGAAGVLADEAG
jgi:hypothetical protein